VKSSPGNNHAQSVYKQLLAGNYQLLPIIVALLAQVVVYFVGYKQAVDIS